MFSHQNKKLKNLLLISVHASDHHVPRQPGQEELPSSLDPIEQEEQPSLLDQDKQEELPSLFNLRGQKQFKFSHL